MQSFVLIVFILSLLGIFAGLLGTVIPYIPGIPLIFVSTLVLAAIDNFQKITPETLVILGVITAISLITDTVLVARGIKRSGGSRNGLIGAALGSLVGFSTASLPGLVVGLFAGLIVGEMLAGSELKRIPNIAFGVVLGFLASAVAQFIIGIVMVAIALVAYFR